MNKSTNKVKAYPHQQDFLDKAKSRTSPITVEIECAEIIVNPGVFTPATATKLLASHVKVRPGDRVIDVTSGTGVVAVIAGLRGATGYAVDINPAAVANSKENFLKHKLDLVAIKSDLFSIVPEEKFDYIYANGPFFEGKIIDPLDFACYGARKFTDDLLSSLPSRLKLGGELLMVIPTEAEIDYLNNKIVEHNLRAEIKSTLFSDDGKREYLLYVINLRS